MSKNWIIDAVEAHFDEVVQFRREIHQNPELSFQEYETSKFIKNSLSQLSFDTVCNTGLVTIIEPSKTEGNLQCIALRADIDALPIQEETQLSFASKNSGVMHACGHDFHTSILSISISACNMYFITILIKVIALWINPK
jgi:amidohydrolase